MALLSMAMGGLVCIAALSYMPFIGLGGGGGGGGMAGGGIDEFLQDVGSVILHSSGVGIVFAVHSINRQTPFIAGNKDGMII